VPVPPVPPVEFGVPVLEHRLVVLLGVPPAVTGCGPVPLEAAVMS